MKKLFFVIAIFSVAMVSPLMAGNDEGNAPLPVTSASVSGVISDEITGEALPGVAVSIPETGEKVFTDLDGKFEISNLKPGSYKLSISYISYKEISDKEVVLKAGNTGVEEIKLEPLAR